MPLYVWPLTLIEPCRPSSTMPMTFFASPVTTGLSASGGNVPGTPVPCAPWQLAQFVEKTLAPLALVCAGGRSADAEPRPETGRRFGRDS